MGGVRKEKKTEIERERARRSKWEKREGGKRRTLVGGMRKEETRGRDERASSVVRRSAGNF